MKSIALFFSVFVALSSVAQDAGFNPHTVRVQRFVTQHPDFLTATNRSLERCGAHSTYEECCQQLQQFEEAYVGILGRTSYSRESEVNNLITASVTRFLQQRGYPVRLMVFLHEGQLQFATSDGTRALSRGEMRVIQPVIQANQATLEDLALYLMALQTLHDGYETYCYRQATPSGATVEQSNVSEMLELISRAGRQTGPLMQALSTLY